MAIALDGTNGITTPLVEGGSIATQAEAEAGTNNTKLMTPLRTEQALLTSRYIASCGSTGGFNSNSGFISNTKVSEGVYRLVHPDTGANMQYVSASARGVSVPRAIRIDIESSTQILLTITRIDTAVVVDTSFFVEVQPIL